jgi:hypothetical protein
MLTVMVSLYSRKMDIRELRDTVVNRLHIHPGGQRLLVHARDSRLRMLDITTASVIQWFSGALNHRYSIKFCISAVHIMGIRKPRDYQISREK